MAFTSILYILLDELILWNLVESADVSLRGWTSEIRFSKTEQIFGSAAGTASLDTCILIWVSVHVRAANLGNGYVNFSATLEIAVHSGDQLLH
jgi:hypothetical protein